MARTLLTSVLLLALFAGCGVGVPTQLQPPEASIVFPPRISMTTADTLLVRGDARQTGGSVATVVVNGVGATSSDGFTTWQAEVPLVPGDNTITVSVEGADGAVTADADAVTVDRQSPLIERGLDMDIDANGDLLVLDLVHGLLRVDTTDGTRHVVSSAAVGVGPALRGMGELAMDRAANRAYALGGFRPPTILTVDLATGDRAEVEFTGEPFDNPAFQQGSAQAFGINGEVGVGVIAFSSGSVAVLDLDAGTSIFFEENQNETAGDVLVLDARSALIHFSGSIVGIDLVTGDRTVFSRSSNPELGMGPSLGGPRGIVLDPRDSNRLLALTRFELLSVSALSGDRAVVSGTGVQSGISVGTGPGLWNAQSLVLSAPEDGVYVMEAWGRILHIDLETGARTAVFEARVGSGPTPLGGDIAVDPSGEVILHADFNEAAIPVSRIVHLDPATGTRAHIAGTEGAERVTFDLSQSLAYVLMQDNRILSLDPATGDLQEVSSTARGAGPMLEHPRDLSYGPHPDTLTVSDNALGIVAIDIPSGDRTVVTPTASFPPSTFLTPSGVATRPFTDFAYVADGFSNLVLEIDLSTGNSSTFADLASSGFAPRIFDIILQEWDGGFYAVTERADERVARIDAVTGAVTTITSTTIGRGPYIESAEFLDAAPNASVAYVSDQIRKIVAVDLVTGERVVVAR